MFEDYIQDAYAFYQLGKKNSSIDERDAIMFYRASVFCASSSIEAFVNFLGETFKQGGRLEPLETAYLNDQALEINPSKASIDEKIKYNSIDNKLKFIIQKFNVPIILTTDPNWQFFLNFKKLRDSLIHSKSQDDPQDINFYEKNIPKGLNANIEIMNIISNKIFERPLRRSLLDMKIF